MNFITRTVLLSILIIAGAFPLQAQVRSVILGVNGLHCSACSYGTEKSLRTLDFIEDIKMDLNKHEAEITFKPGKDINIHAMAQKVVDAGFSVRSVYVVIECNNFSAKENAIYPYQNVAFRFVGLKPQTLQGKTRLRLIGEDFMSKAAFKKWKEEISQSTGASLPPSYSKTEYFVTL